MSKNNSTTFSVDYWEENGKGEIALSADVNGRTAYDTFKFNVDMSEEETMKDFTNFVNKFAKVFEAPSEPNLTLEEKIAQLEAENAALKAKLKPVSEEASKLKPSTKSVPQVKSSQDQIDELHRDYDTLMDLFEKYFA